MKEYVMGNGAIALGALAAGVNLAAGYPGTPSSEIIETISKYPHAGVHLEWSVNEKAAMEVAAAAAYSGARALVTMKQMGLNVAADPLMSVAYVGVKGGMVVVCADDPGPISSQTEQDTRRFADFARIPVFDPSTPEEAFEMIGDAFEYSEKYSTPVIFRPTTRVCHAYAGVEAPDESAPKKYEGFVRDPSKWVIFPRLSNYNHGMIEKRNAEIAADFSSYRFNTVQGSGPLAVITSGVSYAYAGEYSEKHGGIKIIRVATAFPFPEDFILGALEGVSSVICLEELSPYIEEQVLKTVGRHHLDIEVKGKLDGTEPHNGENSAELTGAVLDRFFGFEPEGKLIDVSDSPALPARPPVLCAGCPHRASFYAVKQAMKGRKCVFCGDIGCYTLGNAMPLDMTDTCLCMGADITMAQGFYHNEPDRYCFSFIGDSTFFASGITGVVNAVYNQAKQTICILDNSTTAMTGHQPHPGTGVTMMGEIVEKISIEKILNAIGVKPVITVNPFDQKAAVEAVQKASETPGVSAIIFKAPCIAIAQKVGWEKPHALTVDTTKCIGCRKCINELGCPALSVSLTKNEKGKQLVEIDKSLCTGCGLCSQVCPVKAIN